MNLLFSLIPMLATMPNYNPASDDQAVLVGNFPHKLTYERRCCDSELRVFLDGLLANGLHDLRIQLIPDINTEGYIWCVWIRVAKNEPSAPEDYAPPIPKGANGPSEPRRS